MSGRWTGSRSVSASLRVAAVYSSPLERAVQTARPLAARLALPVMEREALGEIRTGEWTGRSLADLEADPRWRLFNAYRSGTRIPGGERMLEVQLRVVGELDRLREAHPASVVAVVSHGDPIRAALLHYLGMPLDFVLRLEVSPASLSVVALEEWGPRVLLVNDTGGLPLF